MIAIIFDIDGTLVDSAEIDTLLYEEALLQAFELKELPPNWREFKNMTDNGLCRDLFKQEFGKEIPIETMHRAKKIFFSKLHETLPNHGLKEIAGAAAFIERLKQEGNYALALATGAWEESAKLKLGLTGLSEFNLPLHTSESLEAREDITMAALGTLEARHGRIERVIYFGDGLWDLTTTRNLKIGFIGMGRKIEKLFQKGARFAFSDFSEVEKILSAIDHQVSEYPHL